MHHINIHTRPHKPSLYVYDILSYYSVNVDAKLNFNEHIHEVGLCKKAGILYVILLVYTGGNTTGVTTSGGSSVGPETRRW